MTLGPTLTDASFCQRWDVFDPDAFGCFHHCLESIAPGLSHFLFAEQENFVVDSSADPHVAVALFTHQLEQLGQRNLEDRSSTALNWCVAASGQSVEFSGEKSPVVRYGDADFRERFVFGSVLGGLSTGPLPSSNACELPKPRIPDLLCRSSGMSIPLAPQ